MDSHIQNTIVSFIWGIADDCLRDVYVRGKYQFKRAQIVKTIELHLDKETRLLPKGINVLSLFFIDRVEHYRHYLNGEAQKGEYRRIAIRKKTKPFRVTREHPSKIERA